MRTTCSTYLVLLDLTTLIKIWRGVQIMSLVITQLSATSVNFKIIQNWIKKAPGRVPEFTVLNNNNFLEIFALLRCYAA